MRHHNFNVYLKHLRIVKRRFSSGSGCCTSCYCALCLLCYTLLGPLLRLKQTEAAARDATEPSISTNRGGCAIRDNTLCLDRNKQTVSISHASRASNIHFSGGGARRDDARVGACWDRFWPAAAVVATTTFTMNKTLRLPPTACADPDIPWPWAAGCAVCIAVLFAGISVTTPLAKGTRNMGDLLLLRNDSAR